MRILRVFGRRPIFGTPLWIRRTGSVRRSKCLQQGSVDDAGASALEAALASSPARADAAYYLVRTRLAQGEREKAGRLTDRLRRSSRGGDWSVRADRALVAWDLELAERRLREGDSDAALRILQAVLATLGEPDARREVEQRIKAILSGGR